MRLSLRASLTLLTALTVACGAAKQEDADLLDEVSPDEVNELIQKGDIPVEQVEPEDEASDLQGALNNKKDEENPDVFPFTVKPRRESLIEAALPKDVEIKVYRVNPKKKKGPVTQEHMDVFYKGQRVYTWLVSAGCNCMKYPTSGAPYMASTNPGTYKINSRSRYHRSTVFGGAKMEYAMFFDGGRAVHATYGRDHLAKLGQPDSGGCVRNAEQHAAALWNLVDAVGPAKTRVIVADVQDKVQMFKLTNLPPLSERPAPKGIPAPADAPVVTPTPGVIPPAAAVPTDTNDATPTVANTDAAAAAESLN